MKKIIALALALVMVLSLGTVAFAVPDGPGKKDVRVHDVAPTPIEYVGEFVANAAARALQVPALMLGNALDMNRKVIVNTLNVMGSEGAYNGAKFAASLLDNAVAVNSIVAQIRISVAGGAAALAAHGAAGFLDDISGNSTISEMAEKLHAAGRLIASLTEYSNGVVKSVADTVDTVVGAAFTDEIGTILKAIFPKWKNDPAPKPAPEPEQKNSGVLTRVLNTINNVAGDLTLKQLLVVDEWNAESDKKEDPAPGGPKAEVKAEVKEWRATIDSGMSYLAALVDEAINTVTEELEDSKNFAFMKVAEKNYSAKPEANAEVEGGEVAEFLYNTLYNLLKTEDAGVWCGIAPSWFAELYQEAGYHPI